MAVSKKKISKKKGIAKRVNTGMSALAIKEQLQAEAAGISGQIGAPATNSIKLRDKVFTLPDGTVIQDLLTVVVVDFISQNKFYEGSYDPNNVESPVCFAISKEVNGLVPSKNASDMQVKKGEACDVCPMNQWGSEGNGKACKNTRLLAVVLPDDEDKKVYTISVPPTAIKGFDGYVGSVAKMYNLPPIGVLTDISFHPEKTYPLPLFGNPRPNEDIGDNFAFRDDAETMLTVEPEIQAIDPKAKKKTARRR